MAGEVPDLQSQLENILESVWLGERNWRLDDLIDLRAGILPIVRRSDRGRWDGGFQPPNLPA